MKHVHIECLPDEILIKKLGFTRKYVTHHQGKSRVFAVLREKENELAVVDEDPLSVKTNYENHLKPNEEYEGLKLFTDSSGNKVIYLSAKLENWIIDVCRKEKIKLSDFGLPEKPDELHDQINNRLHAFEKLVDELIKQGSPPLLKLKNWLK